MVPKAFHISMRIILVIRPESIFTFFWKMTEFDGYIANFGYKHG